MPNIINNIEIPTLLLKRKDFTNLGILSATGIRYKNNFNSPNELSFTVYKYSDGERNAQWDDISDYNIIYLPEYNEYFDMQVTLNEENGVSKSVTCISLAESELSQVKLYNIELNTEADIARDDYDKDYPTIFYRDLSSYDKEDVMYKKLKNASLLHRILEKASNYKIGYVDPSLEKLDTWYQFSISESTVYDELTGEIAEQYQCMFTFEIQPDGTRIIKAYDLCSTCHTCGYRGDFQDECPKCGSRDFGGARGKDTAVFVSKDNLSASASITSNKDSLKNCFHITGGDDLITASISSINPNGSNDIYYFSEDMYQSMPAELTEKIKDYTALCEEALHEKDFSLNAGNVNLYNQEIIEYLADLFPESDYIKEIPSTITGYQELAAIDYDLTDIRYYLESAMFPDIKVNQETIQDEIRKLTADNLSPIGVRDSSTAVLSSVNNAIVNLCKIYVNTALYKISAEGTYTSGNPGTWNGKITLTSIADTAETETTNDLVISINSSLETYLKQTLEKKLAKLDSYASPITDIDISENDFKNRLHLYNADYLTSLDASFKDCLSVIYDTQNEDLKNKYNTLYSLRDEWINAEQNLRKTQIQYIDSLIEEIKAIKNSLKSELDFQTFLGEADWNLFCSYRREDSYHNSNYISDGLNNAELMARTQELMDAARRELYKAGNLQYDLSANLNNLLALKEFQPLVYDFKTGNWIHLEVDDRIYHLRLLSYEISFDNLANINVEFSTLTKTSNGISDMESILNSVSSISGTYSAFTQQVKNNTESSSYVIDWVKKGLDATKTRFINDRLTQDIVIDQNGILCRAYDDIEDGYDRHQIKINRNGLYTTSNGWADIDTGIGKFVYNDPAHEFQLTEGYGIIAKTVVGSLILGDNLGIYNENGDLEFGKDGLLIKNRENTVSINPNNNECLFKITNSSGTDVFYTDNNGNLTLSGTITGSFFHGGEIDIGNGNFVVKDTGKIITKSDMSLANGLLTYDSVNGLNVKGKINGCEIDSSHFSSGSININDKFVVDNQGNMDCTSATIIDSLYICCSENRDNKVEMIQTGYSTIPAHTVLNTDYSVNALPAAYGNSKPSLTLGSDVYQVTFPTFNTFSGFCHFTSQVQFQKPVLFDSVIETSGIRVNGTIYTGNIYDFETNCPISHWKLSNSDGNFVVGLSSNTTAFRPYVSDDSSAVCNGIVNLGSPNHTWRNLYLSGDINLSNGDCIIAGLSVTAAIKTLEERIEILEKEMNI